MIIRRATLQSDYAEICQWWKTQGKAILSWEILPTLSFIAEEGEEKIACSWLYKTDSVTGFVAWTVHNPKATKRNLPKALKMIQQAIDNAAKAIGVRILFQFSGGGGFSRVLVKSGWTKTLIKHDFLMKEVSCQS
jgi:hypothetical protein